MALNTIHKNKKDIVNAYNITKDKYFKCEIVNDKQSERVRLALGLDLPALRITLKVNGYTLADEKDKIRVLNEEFILVRQTSTFTQSTQFRKRADYEFFNGEQFLFLE
jgi:hypothetical protein